jgi:hypothetical protein
MPRTRHACHPSGERLEAHVLLSLAATAPAVLSSRLVETLATDKSVYTVGEPIRITLTETNTTNSDIVLPSMERGAVFTVSHDLTDFWVKGQGRLSAAGKTLQPGQERTVRVTWNGRPNVGSRSTPPTGSFQVNNTLADNPVTIEINPKHGKGSKAGIVSSVPDETLTLA